MKILLVRPDNTMETIGLQHLMIVEPLELEVIAATVRDNDTVVLADMILEREPIGYFIDKYKPDLVGITGYITNVNTIIAYCKTIKKINSDIITVVGGVHCEVCPDDFDHPSIDYRFIRNAAQGFPGFLDYIENEAILPLGILRNDEKKNEKKLPDFNFDVPFPNRSISDKYRKKYFYIFQNKIALIKTSFGCPFSCSFCFCRVITAGLYKTRPIRDVLEELASIKEKEIYIVDDDFLIDKSRLNAFIQGVKDKGIKKKYLIYGRADFIAKNPEILRKLKSIGLRTVIVGFESFSEHELQQYQKNADASTNRKAMAILNSLGIECFATMIISPEWDVKDFENMVSEIKRLGIHFVNLQPLTPMPSTAFSYSDEEVIIDKKDFEKWDLAHIAVKPRKMSVADFYKQIVRSYQLILFQPRMFLHYLFHQSWAMLYQMIKGSYRVYHQYQLKIKEAENHA